MFKALFSTSVLTLLLQIFLAFTFLLPLLSLFLYFQMQFIIALSFCISLLSTELITQLCIFMIIAAQAFWLYALFAHGFGFANS